MFSFANLDFAPLNDSSDLFRPLGTLINVTHMMRGDDSPQLITGERAKRLRRDSQIGIYWHLPVGRWLKYERLRLML